MTRPSHQISRAAVLLALLAGATAAHAATFSVSNLNDSGSGSLRAAITAANAAPGSDIVDATSQNGAINLLSPLPPLGGTVSVKGAGADKLAIKRTGSGTYRLLSVQMGASVSLSGLTISGGGGGLETGGAINNEGTLNLSGCTLSGNAARRGGAVFSTGTLNIEGSTFTGNTAIGGGAISSSNGFLNVSTSTFNGNISSGDGGALVLLQTRTSLQSSTFSNNSASNIGSGGAVFFSGHFDLSRAGLAITNSTFAGNRAGTGGAIWNTGDALQLQNATITDNTAPTGAGVWSEGNANTLTFSSNSIIAGNSASTSSVGDDVASGSGKNTFVSRGYNLVGGGNGASAFTKTGDKTGLSRAQLVLGALASNGGPTQTLLPSPLSPAVDAIPVAALGVTVDQRGTARPQGRGGDIGSVEIVPSSSTSAFIVNTDADGDDGACTPENCTLREAVSAANAASVKNPASENTITFDLGVFSTPKNITLSSNLNMTAGLPIVGRTRIVGPGVDLVSVYGYPGIALFQVQASAKVAVSGLTLTNGQPHYERGGAVNNAGTLDITGCAVNNNSTRGGIGGAIYNTGTLTVQSCSFNGNGLSAFGLGDDPSLGGGAISNMGTATIRASVFTYNFCQDGGSGGAIFNGGTMTIEDCSLVNNRTPFKGGAISSRLSGTLSVINCTISNNSLQNYNIAQGQGAGLYAEGQLVVRNSTISGNSTQTAQGSLGGGVFIAGFSTKASLENCTITANSADSASGLYVYDGVATVKNTVIAANANNTVTPEVGRRFDSGATIVSGGYNFIGFALGDFSAPGDRAGGYLTPNSSTVTVLDPRLGTLAGNGGSVQTIAPLSDSPLINAGDPAFNSSALPFDQRGPGFPRVVGGRIDIGAFEKQDLVASKNTPSAKSAPKPSGGAS